MAEVNPHRGLKRGERYLFIEMAAVPEGGGRPTHHDEREFDGGGSRFAIGDVLFARITPCTENGKIAFVEALPDASVGFGSTELIVLSARSGKADPRFIYQVTASGRVRRQAVARMLGTSGRQRVPTWFFTEELTVPDFPLPEQRAIAAVLDAIDETIERTEAVIAATEELRRSLLHELLTRGVPGQHSEWRDVPGVGTVPACWDVTTLGEVAEISFSTVDKKANDGEVRVELCNYTDVFYNRHIRCGMKFMAATATPVECARWTLRKGDVIFTKDSETPDEIGVPSLVTENMPNVLCGYHLGLARSHAGVVESSFLARVLASPSSRQQFARVANGVTRFGLTLDATRTLPIVLPPLPRAARHCSRS